MDHRLGALGLGNTEIAYRQKEPKETLTDQRLLRHDNGAKKNLPASRGSQMENVSGKVRDREGPDIIALEKGKKFKPC